MEQQPYIPALGFDWLTRFYDPVLRAAVREETFKRRLVAQVRIEPGHDVLDLGCGTATLTIMAKQACPGARIVGLDGDPTVLAIARKKVAQAGVDVELHEGMAFAVPFPPASFDRVMSSLMLHHLTRANKSQTLVRVRELLRPGVELHVADWGRPQNGLMWLASLGIRFLDGADTTGDNLEGRLPAMMEEAGFITVAETDRLMTAFGTLSLYRAVAPQL